MVVNESATSIGCESATVFVYTLGLFPLETYLYVASRAHEFSSFPLYYTLSSMGPILLFIPTKNPLEQALLCSKANEDSLGGRTEGNRSLEIRPTVGVEGIQHPIQFK